ncbi:MAG TPA: ATP-binding protein [Methylomirabilota bacterium]|nr:ATP-binding protein [Methylomirabilota bacterium]
MITPDTLALAEGYLVVNSLGPRPIRGLPAPLEVYEIVGAATVRSRFQAAASRDLTRFVGRETELDQLQQALGQAGAGRGQVVAVVGEPGIGKSRLYWEFTRSHRTQGWLTLEGGSVSYGKATSYLPVVELLRAYFQIEAGDGVRKITEKVTGKLLSLDRTLAAVLPPLLWLLDVAVDDEAWARLDAAQRLRQTLDHHGWGYHALGRACLGLGRLDEARRLADRALGSLPRHPGFAAHARHLLGDIATHPDQFEAERGKAHYREALALAEPRGMRPLVAHCHLGLGKLSRRVGKGEQAHGHLATGTTMYREMDMRFWLEKAEAEMRRWHEGCGRE